MVDLIRGLDHAQDRMKQTYPSLGPVCVWLPGPNIAGIFMCLVVDKPMQTTYPDLLLLGAFSQECTV